LAFRLEPLGRNLGTLAVVSLSTASLTADQVTFTKSTIVPRIAPDILTPPVFHPLGMSACQTSISSSVVEIDRAKRRAAAVYKVSFLRLLQCSPSEFPDTKMHRDPVGKTARLPYRTCAAFGALDLQRAKAEGLHGNTGLALMQACTLLRAAKRGAKDAGQGAPCPPKACAERHKRQRSMALVSVGRPRCGLFFIWGFGPARIHVTYRSNRKRRLPRARLGHHFASVWLGLNGGLSRSTGGCPSSSSRRLCGPL